MSESETRDSFMQMKTEGGGRAEASFPIHEVSWPFACRAGARRVRFEKLQASHLRPTHTRTHTPHRTESTPDHSIAGGNRGRACLGVLRVSVYGCTYIHTGSHAGVEAEQYATHHLQCMILLFSATEAGEGEKKNSMTTAV